MNATTARQASDHFGRAVDALATGDAVEAACELDAVLAIVPDSADARCLRGVAAGRCGDHERAVRELRAGVQGLGPISADNRDAYNEYGIALTAAGLLGEGAVVLGELTAAQPDFAPAWHNLALVFRSLGSIDEGIAAVRRAIDLGSPGHSRPLLDELVSSKKPPSRNPNVPAVALRAVVEHFARGQVCNALQELYADPNTSLDDFERDEPRARLLLNALDALAFSELARGEAAHLVARLRVGDSEAAPDSRTRPVLRSLHQLLWAQSTSVEELRTAYATAEPGSFDRAVVCAALAERDPTFVQVGEPLVASVEERRLLADQREFVRRIDIVRAAYPNLFVKGERPPFRVVSRCPPPDDAFRAGLATAVQTARLPIVVIEPFEWDWVSLLGTLEDKPCMLAFPDAPALHHAAVLDGVMEAVLDSSNSVMVLDRYPSDHIQVEKFDGMVHRCVVVSSWERTVDAETATALEAAFSRFASETASSASAETPSANWLYAIGRRIAYRRTLARLGDSRAANLAHAQHVAAWYDPHKGLPPQDAPTGAPLDDRIGAISEALRPALRPRLAAVPQRIRLAHVAETIISRGHAPTQVLRALVDHHDRSRFDVTVFASEALPFLPNEWPLARAVTNATLTKGRATIAGFEQQGVRTLIHEHAEQFEQSARAFARRMSEECIDVAVFHGDAAFHILAANASRAPLTVFFDHGQLPRHPGFDLVVTATNEAADKHGASLASLGTHAAANEMIVDVTTDRDLTPLPRAAIGFGDQHRLLTTVSNHLESRLAPEFVAAVAQIMHRFPDAWYLPVGPLNDQVGYRRRFAEHGVADRIRPLGQRDDVLRVLASADLYLNEFPFGGGLAALEAMAVGCPVVTMYDTRGETQGWAAAMYLGVERAVRSCDPRDYVELACGLLADRAMREAWSRYSTERYRQRTDPERYVRRFETLVLDELAEQIRERERNDSAASVTWS